MPFRPRAFAHALTCATLAAAAPASAANSDVYVTRFWHNHQPIYWPEWNSAPQSERVQFAQDSINLKSGQLYDSSSLHPENDLNAIFGVDDRKNAYQSGPRNSLASVNNNGGYAMSYSGSLMDNVNQLGNSGFSGYGSGWWNGNREARTWTTPSGGRRLDLVGFTHHHSLGAVMPKEVLRKEIQIFHEAAYKAWNTGSVTNRSRGFFPTEMAFSRHMIDVLADEGYQWVIVASHHLSRTCPTYTNQANPQGTYNIFSSPPNKADQIGPSPSTGWWFGVGNVGETAWNVSPFAYQLHRAKYVNPETGAEKSILLVPSDDVLSYKYGYADEGTGKIASYIAPFATDPARPVLVMPSTDGDNAWGGGSSSWSGAAPAFMNNGTYPATTIQDFVDDFGAAADTVHVEDGAWIFPESDYGSPQFLKWVEPPAANATATNRVHNTQIDIETPGFTPKFYSWAPVIAGANWCQTAEQLWTNGGGSVAAWKIQDPYDNLGADAYSSPNLIERAWHIYLAGLDSGFNYYGGLGNDDEVKSSLATRRAVELLRTYVTNNLANDATPPTVFKPQRFPYNPGWYTFGWINITPGNSSALKRMRSEFYVWTHAYDVSGITNIVVKLRRDHDGTNPLNSNQNETFAGGAEVGAWVTVPMTKRVLPNTPAALNAAANNGQIQYFSQAVSPEVADYYFVKIDTTVFANLKNSLFDYYIEATDARGNTSRSDIQHVWVEDDGVTPVPPSPVTNATASALSPSSIQVNWTAAANASSYVVTRNSQAVASVSGTSFTDTGLAAETLYSYTVIASNSVSGSAAYGPVGATTPSFIAGNPSALVVTNPASLVTTSNLSLQFAGQAGSLLTNGIRWSNLLNGANGVIAPTQNWNQPVPLGLGSNVVQFTASYGATGTVTTASDSPTNVTYNSGWIDGSSGGFGFGPWTLTGSPNAGTFLADNTHSNMSVNASRGFGLWANNGAVATARRDFDAVLQPGDIVTLRIDNNYIDNGRSVGIGLTDASGTNRLEFYFIGGEQRYRINDATPARDSGVPYTSLGLLVSIQITASNSYQLTTGTNVITGTLAPGGALARLVATNYSAGIDTPFNFYLGEMTRSSTVPILNTTNVLAPVVVRTSGEYVDENPDALLVTTPAVPVTTSNATFLYVGQAGAQLTNGIVWSNTLTGATGLIPSARDWSNSIPLGLGTNLVLFQASYGTTGVVTAARDSATNSTYSGGWSDGLNGGTGFSPWSLTVSGSAGHFIAESLGNLQVGAPKGFGLWANGGGVSTARRDFDTALAPGDTVTIRFDNNFIDNGRAVGFGLTDTANSNRFAFYFVGGEQRYRISDSIAARDSGIPYTNLGLLVTFELLASNQYRFATGTNVIQGSLGVGGPIARLVVTNFSAGSGTDFNLYVGEITRTATVTNLTLTNVAAAAVVRLDNPDTDGDGLPDAWESEYFGSPTAANPAADDDGDGFSNAQEYRLGTHPRDSRSTFQITTVASTGSVLAVTWPATPGRVYQVQSCSQIAGPWLPASTNLIAGPGVTNLTHPATVAGPQAFVRVILVE
jgi:hypothetical protein